VYESKVIWFLLGKQQKLKKYETILLM